MTKAEIFTTAWRVAKAGQAKFGGKSSEYFAEALRMVYAVAKKMEAETVRFETAVAPVKKLLKRSGFGYEMANVKPSSATKEAGVYFLNDGVYQVYTDVNRNKYMFVLVSNQNTTVISKEEVNNYVK